MKSLRRIAEDLSLGRTTSQKLVEQALANISDPTGEGTRAFLKVSRETAMVEAEASDKLRAARLVPSPLAGIPISIKDLFDVAGDVTRAGSPLLENAPPATEDADIVKHLRAAGAVIIGRTNLTEFAYSGIGVNPHFGTPANPYDRKTRRIPGGSSSGAAVSVTDGMAAAAIGSDTGGSVRLPAALCGITGFKPTVARVSRRGVFPLSFTQDSVGPLAPTVACCALLDAVMTGRAPVVPKPLELSGLRFVVPTNYVAERLDDLVAKSFEAALTRLSDQGAWIVEAPFPELEDLPGLYAKGALVGAEAWQLHRHRIAENGNKMDPRIRSRIELAASQDAADYIDLLQARAAMQAAVNARTAPYDAVLMPTTTRIAPAFAELEKDEDYFRINGALLRNTSIGNFLDRCGVSIPCHGEDDPPMGLMAMGETDGDDRLLRVAGAIEQALGRGET